MVAVYWYYLLSVDLSLNPFKPRLREFWPLWSRRLSVIKGAHCLSYHGVSLNGPTHVRRPGHHVPSGSQASRIMTYLHVRVGDIILSLNVLHVAATSFDHLAFRENFGAQTKSNIVLMSVTRGGESWPGQSGLAWCCITPDLFMRHEMTNERPVSGSCDHSQPIRTRLMLHYTWSLYARAEPGRSW